MKNKIVNIWDTIIVIGIFTSIYLLFHLYVEITPIEVDKFEAINLLITCIFILDVILRIIFFKWEYIRSTDIIIDVLACLDIFGPILKAFKLFRFVRLIRFLKLFRLLRVLKMTRVLDMPEKSKELFNIVGLFGLILFVFLGVLISNNIKRDYIDGVYTENCKVFLENIVDNSYVEGKIDIDNFLKSAVRLKNLLSVKIDSEDNNFFYQAKSNEYISKHYFKTDYLTITYKDVTVTLLIKNLNYIRKQVEFYSLFAAVVFYFMLLVIINYSFKKVEENGSPVE